MNAKLPSIVLAAMLCCSCATQPTGPAPSSAQPPPTTVTVLFYGVRNDMPWARGQLQQASKWRIGHPGTKDSLHFPLSEASECNSNRTVCKHAIVKTHLVSNVVHQADKSVKVSGVFYSEMGRALEAEAEASGFSFRQSNSIPENIELIGTGKREVPFRKSLKPGEKFELLGLADARVVIEAE